MTDAVQDRPTPRLTPHLCVAGASDAIDFYTRALGATELFRLPGPDGRLMHASLLVNGAMVLWRDHHHADRRAVIAAVLGAVPMIALGYWLGYDREG